MSEDFKSGIIEILIGQLNQTINTLKEMGVTIELTPEGVKWTDKDRSQ